MIKSAIICEGATEETIVDLLLTNECLIIENDGSLLEDKIIRTRSADNFANRHLGFSFSGPIEVYRILDSKKERFNLSNKIKKCRMVN